MRYDARRTTPAASIAYRLAPSANVYASYIEGFEEGGLAPLTAVNALQALPPLKTRQSELGFKGVLGGVLVQTALFDIRRPTAGTNTATNLYEVTGDASYRGLLENAFDRDYWVAAGNNLLAQGLPRTLRLSATMAF